MSPKNQRDFLSAEKMQLFLAGLSGLPEDEVRKAKVLYIKNAISEYEAAIDGVKAFGCVMVLFAIIPIFWPFLWMQYRGFQIGKRLMRERIENAMDVWREDLASEYIELPW